MFAEWISWAYKDSFTNARKEPLLTMGSAPLEVNEFRSMVLGQLNEPKLDAAIQADISSENSHARALDADIKGELKDLHRRVGTAIMFESTGGQADKVAHLPELRFALGDPNVDTTSIDNAAHSRETKSFYIRKYGTAGYRIHHQPTLKKVMNDRRASLDEEAEVKPQMKKLVETEFERGRTLPIVYSPKDSSAIQDSPRLMFVVLDPEIEWTGNGKLRQQIAEWTRQRGDSQRLYSGAVIWCVKKSGSDLRTKTERWLAWKRVKNDMEKGTLGHDFNPSEVAEIEPKFKDAQSDAKEEVWACYRYILFADSQESDGLRVIDLGAGHSGAGQTLTGRIISALKSETLLNESVGSGIIERNCPPTLKDSGAWPLASLRKSFLDGSLTRLIDPDTALRTKIIEFVERWELGLASGRQPDGDYTRVWFLESISSDEITFDSDVNLLRKIKAAEIKMKSQRGKTEPEPAPAGQPTLDPTVFPTPEPPVVESPITTPSDQFATKTVTLTGNITSEIWNRLGTKIIPKLKSAGDVKTGLEFKVSVAADKVSNLQTELRQILDDLGIAGTIKIEVG